MSVRRIIRAVEGVIVGTILYIPMIFLPLFGPLLAGITAGKTARNTPLNGMILGLFCGLAGSIIWLFSIMPGWRITPTWLYWVIWTLLLLWNILSTIICALGGLMGAMIAAGNEAFVRMQKAAKRGQKNSSTNKDRPPTYVVCPACGNSNPEGSVVCQDCSTKIPY